LFTKIRRDVNLIKAQIHTTRKTKFSNKICRRFKPSTSKKNSQQKDERLLNRQQVWPNELARTWPPTSVQSATTVIFLSFYVLADSILLMHPPFLFNPRHIFSYLTSIYDHLESPTHLQITAFCISLWWVGKKINFLFCFIKNCNLHMMVNEYNKTIWWGIRITMA
jgi:hypothetical protein